MKSLGLGFTDFHITLAFNRSDIHNVRKGIYTLCDNNLSPFKSDDFACTIEALLSSPSSSSGREYLGYKQLAGLLMQQNYLAGAYYVWKYKLEAGESLQCLYDMTDEAVSHASTGINTHTHAERCWRLKALPDDKEDYGVLMCTILNSNVYNKEAYHRLRRFYQVRILVPGTGSHSVAVGAGVVGGNSESHTSHIHTTVSPVTLDTSIATTSCSYYDISYRELPRNFSFIDGGRIAGSSVIDKPKFFEVLEDMGVTDIITVMEQPLHLACSQQKIRCHHFAVNDRTPPTLMQMRAMMQICDDESKKVVVHCLGGVGRTATGTTPL